jgi:diguanylate cyclase (GGDEF)-like protein
VAVGRFGAGTRRGRGYPGEDAWLWRVQVDAEREVGFVRLAVVAFTAAWWFAVQHAAGPRAEVAWGLIGLSAAYATVHTALMFRRPEILGRAPYGSIALDLGFIAAWLWAVAPHQGPYLPLLCAGALFSCLRLPLREGLVTTGAYAAAAVALGGAHAGSVAAYTLMVGGGASLFNRHVLADRRRSLRDALTGAFSREYGMFQMELMARAGHPFAIAVVDLDFFKDVNDRFGHAAGDELLAAWAAVALAQTAPCGMLCRLGGDEFLFVWPGADGQEAARRAEQLRVLTERTAFRLRTADAAVRLSLSAGLAEVTRAVPPDGAVREADSRLYLAKRQRNRIVGA